MARYTAPAAAGLLLLALLLAAAPWAHAGRLPAASVLNVAAASRRSPQVREISQYENISSLAICSSAASRATRSST